MTARDIQQAILSSDLLPSEKLVGLIIAFHINHTTGSTRLLRQTIVDESGLSLPSVKRACKSLVKMRFLSKKSTGRSSVFLIPSPGNNTGTVEGSPVDRQKVHDEPHLKPSIFDLDTEFSTPAEERNKRDEAAFLKDQSGNFIAFDGVK